MEKTQIAEQEQFEAWAKQANTPYCLLPSKYNNGKTYRTERTQHAFEGFKAGLQLATPALTAPSERHCTISGCSGAPAAHSLFCPAHRDE